MKKLVATAAVAAMLGSAAFADVNIGSWVSGVWGFGNGASKTDAEKNDFYTANTQSWGGKGPRTAIDATGDAGNIGFQLQAFGNGDELGMGDNAKVWWSPVEQFKLQLGKVGDGSLQGNACYGMWDLYRLGAVMDEEGWTFMNQDAPNGGGAVLGVFPIEGLKIYASLGFPFGNSAGTYTAKNADDEEVSVMYNKETGLFVDSDGNTYTTATANSSANLAEVFGRNSKYAVAYDIEGVGTVKVGLDTTPARVDVKDGDTTKKKDQNIINAAFDLTAVENLYVGIGAYIPMVQKTGTNEIGVGNKVNLFARYGMDALTVSARVGTKIGVGYKDDKGKQEKSGFGFLVGGCVEYEVMESISVFGEVDYADGIYFKQSKADNSDVVDFGLGVRKSYDGGSVSVAFEGATNNNGMFKCAKADDFAWCVPIVIRQSF